MRPALDVLHGDVVRGEGLRLLEVIPGGPAHHRAGVGIPLAARIGDEPLLGDIELAAQPPEGAVQESVETYFGGTEMLPTFSPASSRRCKAQVRSQASRFCLPECL